MVAAEIIMLVFARYMVRWLCDDVCEWPSLYMGIPMVSYCYHGDGSGVFIPDGDLPIANTKHGWRSIPARHLSLGGEA